MRCGASGCWARPFRSARAVAIRAWLKEPLVTSTRALRFREDMLSLLGPFLDGVAERHGYAPGENTVALATQEENAAVLRQEFGDRLPAAIAEFLGAISKMSLPDVHIGYFGPPSYIVGLRAARAPYWADLADKRREVLVFGSDGGGSLYASHCPAATQCTSCSRPRWRMGSIAVRRSW
jgi:hypothetical protein